MLACDISRGAKHPRSMKIQLRTENDCANVPYSVCCIRGEGQALAFSTEIPEYQAIMVKQKDVEIVVTSIVNLASFLGGNRGEPVHHDCLESTEATYSSCLDLKDTPMENVEN